MEENLDINSQPILEQKSSLKLTQGMNGKRGFEIKAYGDTVEEIEIKIRQLTELAEGLTREKEENN